MQEDKIETPKPKPVRYLSIKRDECDILRTLGLRERWLYTEIKWLAEFKSGIAGYFGKQRITYDQLAALVHVPASQGRAADSIDRKEALRLMQRLEQAGLVADISERKDNHGLTFKLPLSPLDSGGKLPQAEAANSPENPDSTRVSGKQESIQSVLKDSKDINTPISIGGRNLEASVGGAAAASSTPPPEDQNSAPQALTLSSIEKRLTTAGFQFVQSAKSRSFYARWVDRGITFEQFERAAKSVVENFELPQTPDSVDEELRNWCKRQRSGRGRVAL